MKIILFFYATIFREPEVRIERFKRSSDNYFQNNNNLNISWISIQFDRILRHGYEHVFKRISPCPINCPLSHSFDLQISKVFSPSSNRISTMFKRNLEENLNSARVTKEVEAARREIRALTRAFNCYPSLPFHHTRFLITALEPTFSRRTIRSRILVQSCASFTPLAIFLRFPSARSGRGEGRGGWRGERSLGNLDRGSLTAGP